MCLQTKAIYQKDGSFFKPSRPKMMTRVVLRHVEKKIQGIKFCGTYIYTQAMVGSAFPQCVLEFSENSAYSLM